MFAFGFVIIAIAVWLGDSAIQNRSPIATLEAIIKDPANTRTTLTATKGRGTPTTAASGAAQANQHSEHSGAETNVTGAGGGPVAQAAVAYAVAQLGKPYKWSAEGPNAFDCSGLCYAAYKAAGLTIPRTTAGQIVGGKMVTKAKLQPGDLIFPYPGHVFMYTGNGQCVEAPHTGAVVHVTNIYSFFTARRYA